MLTVKQYKVGALCTNCYLITDKESKKSAIIDPGGISSKLDKEVELNNLSVEYILLTHGHFDHIRKVARYKNKTNAKILINHKEKDFPLDPNLNLSCKFAHMLIEPFDIDILLNNEETIKLGSSIIKILHTPGHTVGSSCFLIDNCIFTGDTLMKQSIGRTDFATGSSKDMVKSLAKLLSLKNNFIIYPGHGDISTLAFEKSNNLYLSRIRQDQI